jgi:esterase/lipase superfamily enzyme
MGDAGSEWNDLYQSSLAKERVTPVVIELEDVAEMALLPIGTMENGGDLSPELQTFVDSVNDEISQATDKEIMVYVHGTKVDFENATVLTAEIDHYAGRDFVGFAFAWPSHQNILSYLTGTDVDRALGSSAALESLLLLLAEHTDAQGINILAYSAGGKVASKALYEIRQAFSDVDAAELRDKTRLGSVVFAAADVSVDVFLQRLPSIAELANQVVITVSDSDNALIAAKRFMGGMARAGTTEAESMEESFIAEKHLLNVEIIDVSHGQQARGFDIVGHHYWYRHPWMSSDIIFLMRTDLPPARRGLSSAQPASVWYLSSDYPDRIRRAAEIELEGQW